MPATLVSIALSALAARWHGPQHQQVISKADIPFHLIPSLGLDDHMLRDIGIRDGNYCRKRNPYD